MHDLRSLWLGDKKWWDEVATHLQLIKRKIAFLQNASQSQARNDKTGWSLRSLLQDCESCLIATSYKLSDLRSHQRSAKRQEALASSFTFQLEERSDEVLKRSGTPAGGRSEAEGISF